MKKLSELKPTQLVVVDKEIVMEAQDLKMYNYIESIHIAIPEKYKINAEVALEDIWDMQKILDRHKHTVYCAGEEVENDLLEEN